MHRLKEHAYIDQREMHHLGADARRTPRPANGFPVDPDNDPGKLERQDDR